MFQVIRGHEYRTTLRIWDDPMSQNFTDLINLADGWQQVYNVEHLSGYRDLHLFVDDIRVVYSQPPDTYQKWLAENTSFPSLSFSRTTELQYSDLAQSNSA